MCMQTEEQLSLKSVFLKKITSKKKGVDRIKIIKLNWNEYKS